ncbi:MAG TPA: SPOR domain-containing protein [Bacteroidales bacterium]|nr:SPOR domain-containing protein [Bacteroidales bacterium]
MIFNIQGIGSFESDVVYHNTLNKVFIPVEGLFEFLKISYVTDDNLLIIQGFFIEEQRKYEIDARQKTIILDGKVNRLSDNEILITESGIHVSTDVLGKVFGLHASFSFRNMTVDIKTDLELPAIREMRLMQFRQNIQQLQGDSPADTTYDQRYHFFRFGMIDWSLISTQVAGKTTDNRFSIGIGMELLAGETNIFLNHSTREGINLLNQQYLWRFVDNNNRYIKQVQIGKINPGTISTVFQPFNGITVTNASTSFRKFFGTYNYSAYTQPGWVIELYVNGVMITYKKADESGFFSFEVPIVYGSSEVMLKFYGPFGEERIKEQFINIPFQILPKGEFEYSISSAHVKAETNNLLVKAAGTYGLTKHISIGGGYEHFIFSANPSIPLVNLTINPTRNLIISSEYAHGVRTKGLLHYQWRNKWMLEFDYSRYTKGQKAIHFNYVSESRGTLHIPFNRNKFTGAVRLTYKQNAYELLRYNTSDITLNAYRGPVSASLTTYSTWIDTRPPVITGTLSVGFRIPAYLIIRPQIIYNYSDREFTSVKMELEKRIYRSGSVSLAYHENFTAGYRGIEFSFRWDLSFSQFHSSAIISNFDITTGQGANGSITCDAKESFINFGNKAAVGRSGLLVYPFLDVNHNGEIDKDEPLVPGVKMKISGGKILDHYHDTLIRIMELEAFTTYCLRLDDANLDNIAWQYGAKKINIITDPNQFKEVLIPVKPLGEINGRTMIDTDGKKHGQGRIRLNIFTSEGVLVARTVSENDGYFTFLGLAPGDYHITLDSSQLRRSGLWSATPFVPFSIKPDPNGDILYGIDFLIEKSITDTLYSNKEPSVKIAGTDTLSVRTAPENVTVQTKADSLIPKVELSDQVSDPDLNIRQWQDSTDVSAETKKGIIGQLIETDSLSAGSHKTITQIISEDSIDRRRKTYQTHIQADPGGKDSLAKLFTGLHQASFVITGKNDIIEDSVVRKPASGKQAETSSSSIQIFLQAGAFRNYSNALNYANRISLISPKVPFIVYEDQYFKVRIGHFANMPEAESFKLLLQPEKHRYYIDTAGYGTFPIDCGLYNSRSLAMRRLRQLEIHNPGAIIIQQHSNKYRVLCGYLGSREEVETLLQTLKSKGITGLKIPD